MLSANWLATPLNGAIKIHGPPAQTYMHLLNEVIQRVPSLDSKISKIYIYIFLQPGLGLKSQNKTPI